MRALSNLCVSFIVFVITSCGSEKLTDSQNLIPININPNEVYEGLLSGLFEIVDIVFLEDQEASVISAYDITKMRYYDGFFYLFDDWRRRGLFSFDSDGQFVMQVGKRGRGPGEYMTPRDFNINHWQNRIEIYDVLNDKLLFYCFNGEHIGEYNLIGRKARAYEVIDPFNYAFFNVGDYDEALAQNVDDYEHLPKNFFLSPQSEFSVNLASIPTEPNYDFMNSSNPFSNYNGNVLFMSGLRDTIYSVSSDGVEPGFVLNFSGERLPPQLMKTDTDMEIMSYLENNFVPGYKMFLNETADHISFCYSYGRGMSIVFYNKHNGEVINIGHKTSTDNEIDVRPLLFPPRCIIKDTMFVSLVEPADFFRVYDDFVKASHDNQKDPRSSLINMEEIASRIEMDSNPFLIIYKLK